MKKLIVKAITLIAVLAILFAGTGDQLGAVNLTVILASLAWVSLVAVATFMGRRKSHDK